MFLNELSEMVYVVKMAYVDMVATSEHGSSSPHKWVTMSTQVSRKRSGGTIT
jgi:hypothetical protein